MRPTPGLGMAGMLWLFLLSAVYAILIGLPTPLPPRASCQVLRRHAVLGFTGAGQYPLQIQHFILALYYLTTWSCLGNFTQSICASSGIVPRQAPGPCPVYALKVSTSILPSPPLKPHPHLQVLLRRVNSSPPPALSFLIFSTSFVIVLFSLSNLLPNETISPTLDRSSRQACGKRISAQHTLSEHNPQHQNLENPPLRPRGG